MGHGSQWRHQRRHDRVRSCVDGGARGGRLQRGVDQDASKVSNCQTSIVALLKEANGVMERAQIALRCGIDLDQGGSWYLL